MESPTKAGAKKTINKVKAALLARQGPAEKDQFRSPIADAIARYWEEDVLSFSIPAHGGGRGPAPEFTKWAGLQSARADLPTSHGIDTRDRAFQVQATAQELFAEATGAKQVLFSTNGSSLSVHVAITSVVGPGETAAWSNFTWRPAGSSRAPLIQPCRTSG